MKVNGIGSFKQNRQQNLGFGHIKLPIDAKIPTDFMFIPDKGVDVKGQCIILPTGWVPDLENGFVKMLRKENPTAKIKIITFKQAREYIKRFNKIKRMS